MNTSESIFVEIEDEFEFDLSVLDDEVMIAERGSFDH